MNRNKTNEENEMRNKKNNMLSIILPTVALLCAGCTVERPIESLFAPGSTGTAVGKADSPGRFQDAGTGNPSAIDSAMELSAKYAKLIEEMAAIKADNQRLTGENLILKDQLAPCSNNLTQAQKELAEANDLLIEMRIELNNWKSNILGFRDEMRSADNAQLDALVKILEVLGGQAKAKSPLDLGANSMKTAPQDPNNTQPVLQAGTAAGQVNG